MNYSQKKNSSLLWVIYDFHLLYLEQSFKAKTHTSFSNRLQNQERGRRQRSKEKTQSQDKKNS